MKKGSSMQVTMNKGTGWFFKLGDGVFVYFEKVIMEIIENNF